MAWCEVCGSQHIKSGERCTSCFACLRLCSRQPGCSFINDASPLDSERMKPSEDIKHQNKINSIIPKHIKIEDAIKCWMLSSVGEKYNINFLEEDIVLLSKQLIDIMDDKLNLVDQNFEYFVVKNVNGKKVVEDLNKSILFINQDLDYIIYEDYKRVNLGKKVAIMEGSDDTV